MCHTFFGCLFFGSDFTTNQTTAAHFFFPVDDMRLDKISPDLDLSFFSTQTNVRVFCTSSRFIVWRRRRFCKFVVWWFPSVEAGLHVFVRSVNKMNGQTRFPPVNPCLNLFQFSLHINSTQVLYQIEIKISKEFASDSGGNEDRHLFRNKNLK